MEWPVRVPIWAALLALVGAGMVIAGIQGWAWGGVAKFHYEVDPVNDDSVNKTLTRLGDSLNKSDDVYEFSNLSTRSQEILRAAITADGGAVSRYGQGNGAPDIDIPGHVYGWGESRFFLEYRDSYYRLETAGTRNGLGMFDALVSSALVFVGLPLWFAGLVAARSARLTASTVVGVATVALLVPLGLYRVGLTSRPAMVAGGLFIGAGSAVVVWYFAGYDPERSSTT